MFCEADAGAARSLGLVAGLRERPVHAAGRLLPTARLLAELLEGIYGYGFFRCLEQTLADLGLDLVGRDLVSVPTLYLRKIHTLIHLVFLLAEVVVVLDVVAVGHLLEFLGPVLLRRGQFEEDREDSVGLGGGLRDRPSSDVARGASQEQLDGVHFRELVDLLRNVLIGNRHRRQSLHKHPRRQNQQIVVLRHRIFLVSLIIKSSVVDVELEICKNHVTRFIESLGSLAEKSLADSSCLMPLQRHLKPISKFDTILDDLEGEVLSFFLIGVVGVHFDH